MKDDEKALHEFDYNEHHRRKCRVCQLKSDHKKIAQDDPVLLQQHLTWNKFCCALNLLFLLYSTVENWQHTT